MISEILQLQGGEDDGGFDREPLVAGAIEIEVIIAVVAGGGRHCDSRDSHACDDQSQSVDEIADRVVDVGSAQVVVHPGQQERDGRRSSSAQVRRDDQDRWHERQQQVPRLQGSEPAGRNGAPGLVDRVFAYGARGALVGDCEGQDVQPHPQQCVWKLQSYGLEIGRCVGGQSRAGEGVDHAGCGPWAYHDELVVTGE